MYCPVASRVRGYPGKRARLQDCKPLQSPNRPCVLTGKKAPLLMVRRTPIVPKNPNNKAHSIHFSAPSSAQSRGTIVMEYSDGQPPPQPTEVLKSYYSLLASGHLPKGMQCSDGEKPHTYSPHGPSLHQWREMWRDYERHLLLTDRNNSNKTDKHPHPHPTPIGGTPVAYKPVGIDPMTPVPTPRVEKEAPTEKKTSDDADLKLPKLSYTKTQDRNLTCSSAPESPNPQDDESSRPESFVYDRPSDCQVDNYIKEQQFQEFYGIPQQNSTVGSHAPQPSPMPPSDLPRNPNTTPNPTVYKSSVSKSHSYRLPSTEVKPPPTPRTQLHVPSRTFPPVDQRHTAQGVRSADRVNLKAINNLIDSYRKNQQPKPRPLGSLYDKSYSHQMFQVKRWSKLTKPLNSNIRHNSSIY